MFTGLVREVGRVVVAAGGGAGLRLEVDAPQTAPVVVAGGSVAIDGVCLTAESVTDSRLTFHAVSETLQRTSLGGLAVADPVNVEPALRVGDPLGGHLVQGHVDGVGRARSIVPAGDGASLVVSSGDDILRYCVAKGSITVAGVSLTVASCGDDSFSVALVPHTLAHTTLGSVEEGDELNLEVDVLAKYVERLLEGHRP
jgi:riboflavin synthase